MSAPFNIKLDPYSEVFNTKGLIIVDGSPVTFKYKDKLYIYLSGIRDHQYDPIKKNADGIGTICFTLGKNLNLGKYDIFSFDNVLLKNYSHSPVPSGDVFPDGTTIRSKRVTKSLGDYDQLVHLSGLIQENNSILGFAQVEDVKNREGKFYDDIYGVGCGYGRILLLRGDTISSFSRTSYNYYPELNISEDDWNLYNCGKPIIENWQSEDICLAPGSDKNPNGISGVAFVDCLTIGEYVYIFYTRFVDTRIQNWDPDWSLYPYFGYKSFLSQVILPDGGVSDSLKESFNKQLTRYFQNNLCVARAKISDLLDPNFSLNKNPFKKYRKIRTKDRGGRWTGKVSYDENKKEWYYSNEPIFSETWEECGFRGLDTAINLSSGTYGRISFNTYLNRYLWICQGENFSIKLFYSDEGMSENSILKWTEWGTIPDIKSPCYYPSLINEEGDDNKITGERCWLFYNQDINCYKDLMFPRNFRKKISFKLS